MAGGRFAVSETIELRRVDAARAREAVATAILASGQYHSRGFGTDTLQFSRTYRPRWLLVCAWTFTIAFLGLGVWLFFVKRTETCSVTVVEDLAVVRITIAGHLDPSVLSAVRTALERLAVADAIDVGEVVVDRPTTRGAGVPFIDLLAHEPAPTGTVVRFDTGEIVTVEGVAVVGRDPVALAADGEVVARVPIRDDSSTVSKTHFAMGVDRGELWIEDRQSTNGTSVGESMSLVRRLTHGERVFMGPGDVILFGDRRAQVVQTQDLPQSEGSSPHSV